MMMLLSNTCFNTFLVGLWEHLWNFSEFCDCFCTVTVFFKVNDFTKNRNRVKYSSLVYFIDL